MHAFNTCGILNLLYSTKFRTAEQLLEITAKKDFIWAIKILHSAGENGFLNHTLHLARARTTLKSYLLESRMTSSDQQKTNLQGNPLFMFRKLRCASRCWNRLSTTLEMSMKMFPLLSLQASITENIPRRISALTVAPC